MEEPSTERFPSADEIPESDPSMWGHAPGEVPGTGGMTFPDAPDLDAGETQAVADPEPAPDLSQWDPSWGTPPPGYETTDEYGRGTGYDAYGNPIERVPEPPPTYGPGTAYPLGPPGYETTDEYGRGTGYDAYGDPVTPSNAPGPGPIPPPPPPLYPMPGNEEIIDEAYGE
jgi:hypothetical protein